MKTSAAPDDSEVQAPPEPGRKIKWRSPLVLGGAAFLIIAIGGGAAWYFTRSTEPEAPPQATQAKEHPKAPPKDAEGKKGAADSPPPKVEKDHGEAKAEAPPQGSPARGEPANPDTHLVVVARTLDGLTVNAYIEVPVPEDQRAGLGKYTPYLKEAFARYLGSAKANALASPQNRPELVRYLSEIANEELPAPMRVKEVVLTKLVINAPQTIR